MKRVRLALCLTFFFLSAASVTGFGQTVATPTAIFLTAQSGGPEVSQKLSITTPSPAGFLIIQNPQVSWLRVNPSSGTTPAQVDVIANPAGLSLNAYSTTLQIFSGSNPAVVVNVGLSISNLGASPSSLTFTYQTGGVVPVAQTLTITGSSGTPFNATANAVSGPNWLQVAPATGTTPVNLSVGLNSAVIASLPAGTYNGNVNINPISSSVGAITIPVTLTVTATAQVTASPNSLSFGYQTGGTNNVTQQALTLSTNSVQAVSYGVVPGVDPNPAGLNWLSLNPTGGAISSSTAASVAVTVNPGSLPQGSYNGKITVFTPGSTPASQDVSVHLNVSSLPLLNVPSGTLNFTYQVGTNTPAAQTVTPTSTSTALQYTISASTSNGGNWLSVPSFGTTPTGFPVSVNPSGLATGTYNGTITVTGVGTGTPPQLIPVVLKVSNDPVIIPSVTSLSFAFQIGQNPPPLQTVKVGSTPGTAITYTATATPSWLVLGNQTSGGTDGIFTVQANPAGQAAGTYDGSITITAFNPLTGVAVPNSPLTIPVKLYVSATPLLLPNPTSLSFAAQVGSASPGAQTITLSTTSSTEQLSFNVQFSTDNGGNWLFAGPQSGSTPNTLVVSVVPALLSGGVYSGNIRITATTAGGAAVSNSPIVIPVTLTMTQGTLQVNPSSLSFTQTLGNNPPAAQTLSITSTAGPTTFTAAPSNGTIAVTWISVSANNGTTPGTISVSAEASRLTPGTYQGLVTITAPGLAGSPAQIPVTFTVNGGTISATPTALTFNAVQGGSAPAAQTVSVASSTGALSYTVAVATQAGGSWLSTNTASGSTPGTISLTVNPAGLTAGTYNGSVTINSPGSTGSPITIPVTFTVASPLVLSASPASLTFAYTTGLTVPAAQTVSVATAGGTAPFTAAAQMSNGSGWLVVTPTSGTTPGTVSVSVTPQNLAAGTYNGTVSISSSSSTNPVSVAVTLTVIAIPPPSATAVVNSASFAAGPVAPGEIVTLGGTGMANVGESLGLQLDGSGSVATRLGDTRVLFDGVAAPIIYVSPTQISAVVPYSAAGRVSTRIQVEYKGVLSPAIDLRVVDAAPAIFTQNQSGTGPGVIANQNFSLNTATNPAAKGSVVVVYATGEGQTSPAGVTGSVTPNNGSGLKLPLLTVTATVGGRPARVLYAGSAPGFIAGAFQVNVEIPADAPSGVQPIVLSAGTIASQPGVTVAVQ